MRPIKWGLSPLSPGGQGTATAQVTVRLLGDVNGDGQLTTADRVLMIKKINGRDVGGLVDRAFDLDCANGCGAVDRSLLNTILNGLAIP